MSRYSDHTPVRVKCIAWLTIALQVAFPSAITFTPFIAQAASHNAAAAPAQKTTVYTLKAGETTATVAAKFNISLSALRTLNQFRTFARSFDHLRPGDELDVPQTVPSTAHADAPAAKTPTKKIRCPACCQKRALY